MNDKNNYIIENLGNNSFLKQQERILHKFYTHDKVPHKQSNLFCIWQFESFKALMDHLSFQIQLLLPILKCLRAPLEW